MRYYSMAGPQAITSISHGGLTRKEI
jgi:hypothetical protein